MAIISARINDNTKAAAEEVANKLGLSLSNVISVFLNRFIAEKGFPFDVTIPKAEDVLFNQDELQAIVKDAIKNNTSTPDLPKSAYIDSKDNSLKFTK